MVATSLGLTLAKTAECNIFVAQLELLKLGQTLLVIHTGVLPTCNHVDKNMIMNTRPDPQKIVSICAIHEFTCIKNLYIKIMWHAIRSTATLPCICINI